MPSKSQLGILDDMKEVPSGALATIVIRHAQREQRGEFFPDINRRLTKEGFDSARTLGERLKPFLPLRFFSSPIERCTATAEAIMEGVGTEYLIQESSILGKPGPFVLDSTRTSKTMQELGKDFIQAWFDGELSKEMIRMPQEGTRSFLQWLIDKRKERVEGLDIHISHDLIITAVIATLLEYDVQKEGLVTFLDGFLLYRRNEKRWGIISKGQKKIIKEYRI